MKWHAMLSDLSATFTALEGCYPQVRDGLCWRESNASKTRRKADRLGWSTWHRPMLIKFGVEFELTRSHDSRSVESGMDRIPSGGAAKNQRRVFIGVTKTSL